MKGTKQNLWKITDLVGKDKQYAKASKDTMLVVDTSVTDVPIQSHMTELQWTVMLLSSAIYVFTQDQINKSCAVMEQRVLLLRWKT